MTKTPPAPTQPVPVKPRTFNARFNAGLSRVLEQLKVQDVPHIHRIIITVVGGTVLLLGAAMVFLPGPGSLVMLAGLALLGTEYAWARRLMRKGRLMAHKALSKTQQIFSSKDKAEPIATAEEKPVGGKPTAELVPVSGEAASLVR